MKKYIIFIFLSVILGEWSSMYAQTADGGIFGSGNTLIVKFKPSADITGGFTGGNFGIRWLSSLGAGVNLSGEISSFGYVNQGAKSTSGSYDYIVYASTSSITSTTYTSGTEYTLMTVTVTGGTGTGTFELCPGGFAGDAGKWYIELGGSNKANVDPASWYYAPTASNVPLPVELSSFSALVNVNNVTLNWKTSTEVNNNGFEVERKGELSNTEWIKLSFVQGYGNSNSPKEYTYTDKDLTGGTKYMYRLKQIDNDGKYQYSKEVEVEVVPKEYSLYQNYPNPFNPSTTIKFDLPESSEVNLTVYNILGEKVITLVNGMKKAGYHSVEFNAGNIASGMYIYRLQTPNFIQTKKMLLLK